jgi:hypothetical protein
MGGAEPSPFLAVEQAHLVSEARRLTAGGTPVVEEARGGGRGCYRTDLCRALAMVVGLRCLSLRRRRRRRTRWLCNLDKMCKLAKLLGKAAVLSILSKLHTVLGARGRSAAVEFCKPLQPAVHGEFSHRRGEISQSPRGLLVPVRLACRIHPASASTRSALDRRTLSRAHAQPGSR